MSSAAGHRKPRKIKKTGRHCAPLTAQKAAKRLGIAVPALALPAAAVFGVVVAAQANPAPLAGSNPSHHSHLAGLAAPEHRVADSAAASTLNRSAKTEPAPRKPRPAPTHPTATKRPGATPSATPSAAPTEKATATSIPATKSGSRGRSTWA